MLHVDDRVTEVRFLLDVFGLHELKGRNKVVSVWVALNDPIRLICEKQVICVV